MNPKVKKGILVVVGIIALVVLLYLVTGGNIAMAGIFLDIPSLVIIVFPLIFILLFSDTWGDYIRAYKFVAGNKEYTTKELKASVLALDLSINITSITGGIGTLIGIMISLVNIADFEMLGVYLAIILITVLYALIINAVQMPIRTCIKKELVYREN